MPRYEYSPGAAAFPIGFEYEDPAHVGVNLVLPTGVERRLTLNSDYVIDGDIVVYVLPKGHGLVIFDDAPASGPVFRASLARAVAMPEPEPAAPVVIGNIAGTAIHMAQEEEQATQALPADDTRLAALEAKLAALESEKARLLDLERAKTSDAQIQAVNQSGQAGVAAIEQTTNEAITQLRAVSASATRNALESVAQASQSIDSAAERAKEAASNVEGMASEAESRMAAMLVDLDDRLARIEAQNAESARKAQALIAQAQSAALLDIDARAESVALQNEANARLEGSPWASEGY